MNFSECIHGLDLFACNACRKSERVYVTGGGVSWHRRQNCEDLREGQQIVRERGGDVSPIESVSLSQAESMGRLACRSCAR